MSTDDTKQGDLLRDEALARVALPAKNQYWACLSWARSYMPSLRKGSAFTSFALREVYPYSPAEPRVWGAVMNQLRREGFVSPTDRFIKYPSASRHSAPARVWVRT